MTIHQGLVAMNAVASFATNPDEINSYCLTIGNQLFQFEMAGKMRSLYFVHSSFASHNKKLRAAF
jgi:hypothetical protein